MTSAVYERVRRRGGGSGEGRSPERNFKGASAKKFSCKKFLFFLKIEGM